jgi:hypothetical protein
MDVTFMGAEPRMNGRLSWWRCRYRSVLAVLLLPSLLLIGVFSYYPAVRSLIGGFYQWNGFSPPTYAGVSQFRQYLQAPTFGTEAKNIAILVGGSILISLVSQRQRAGRRLGAVRPGHLRRPAGVQQFVSSFGLSVSGGGSVFAALVIATLPMFVLVGFTMRYFVSGLTEGATKL